MRIHTLYVVQRDNSGGGDGTSYADSAFFTDAASAVACARSTGPYYGMVYRREMRVYDTYAEYAYSSAIAGPTDVLVWDYWRDEYVLTTKEST